MKKSTFENLISIFKIFLNIRNHLEYISSTSENSDKEIKELNENIKNIINIFEESPAYFDESEKNIAKTSVWLNDLKSISNHDIVILSEILSKKEKIYSITNEFKECFRKQQNIENDYNFNTQFINQLRQLKIIYDTNLFSNVSEKKISDIKFNLSQTISSYEKVNSIYDDIKNKNEKFNYFIDSENNKALKELYDSIYAEENKKADDYRTYAVVIFLFVAFLIFLIIFSGIMQNLSYIQEPNKYIAVKYDLSHLIRFLGIFSLTVPAWFFVKESGRHRQVAYKAKILGTELTAFPHYVKDLSNEDRIEMRKELANKFFGQELYSDKSKDNSIEQSKVTVDALKTVTSLLNKNNSKTEN